MKEFLRENFDKLLLTGLFLLLVAEVNHMGRDSRDAVDVSWAREEANLIIGGLLGIITGGVLHNRPKRELPPSENPPKLN